MPSTSRTNDLLAAIEEIGCEEGRRSRLSPNLVVYCDEHLGVPMDCGEKWILVEGGEASGDVNRLEYWRCPQAGCVRCYEPEMYGYHSCGSEMGSRIEPNLTEQPRCEAHVTSPSVPFLYIGKVGDGRRYLCPLYKCTHRGEVVARGVVDERVAIPDNPMAGFSKWDRQRFEELTVFKLFVAAANLEIEQGSATNADPPNPDVRCTIAGAVHYFELGRIIS